MATKRSGISRIVVGVDGSEHSAAALEWAVRMAKGMGSEVVAVFAISPPLYFDAGYMAPVAPPQFDPEWRNEMKKEFEGSWCKRLRDAGGASTPRPALSESVLRVDVRWRLVRPGTTTQTGPYQHGDTPCIQHKFDARGLRQHLPRGAREHRRQHSLPGVLAHLLGEGD